MCIFKKYCPLIFFLHEPKRVRFPIPITHDNQPYQPERETNRLVFELPPGGCFDI